MNQQVLDYIVSYAIPLTTVGLGVIMGWIFKKFIHHRIKKLTERTEWKGDDVIFEAIESHIVLWFFLVALNIDSTDIQGLVCVRAQKRMAPPQPLLRVDGP